MALASPAQAAAYDLVVTDVRPAQPGVQATGSRVVFEATVKNIGTAATPSGTPHGVAFTVNGRAVAWDDTSRSSLAPGRSVTIRATGGPSGSSYWTAQTGQFTLGATVDDVDRIRSEANERNNSRTASLKVTPVKPVTAITAAPAMTQAEFEDTHAKTVELSWKVPAGQPVGVSYAVTEHPAYEQCGGGSIQQGDTEGTSLTFDIATAPDCGSSQTFHTTRYTVTSVGPRGAAEVAESGGECEWVNAYDRYAHGQTTTSLTCDGAPRVLDFDDPTWALIDAGATAPSYGWEGDSGFDKGQVFTANLPGLTPEQATSRWGWSRYEAHVTSALIGYPGKARLTFVEPTFSRAGQRVFDVKVNGRVVAKDLDIFAEVGRGKPYVLEVPVDATSGVVTVEATKKVDNPIIATIEVIH
ncbi:malectin domain-containing carbohydrate-binding protein [Kineococcus arenarius]|uniref:malectin domain-containing carbohydrate-binding protein n=1 Tax=Kineococcus sp. SYSU DK007 TaxID=3383128 RepID=UPI003D7E97AF